MKNITMSVIRD